MKKTKHIQLNLTEDQYNAIEYMALKDNRNITNMAYLLITDAINKNIIKYVDNGGIIYKETFKH